MIFAALNVLAYLALALAAWAAFRGGPAAGALVASNIGARLATLLGFEFDVVVWFAIDVAVMCWILTAALLHRRLLHREMAILALFFVAWRFYWIPAGFEDATNVQFVVVTLVVTAQLMLTLPWRTIYYRLAEMMGTPPIWRPHRLERVGLVR